jgi:hypothetical protein
MADQPIPVGTANTDIATYISFMTNLGVNMNLQTQTVSFNGTVLMHWLGTVMPFADELRICMAAYPAGHPKAGRTTVILWPYKNGQPAVDGSSKTINPFNDGQGFP